MSSTVASPDPAIPMRDNSFFTHLNYDVRVMIYEYLDPAAVSVEALGLILSCREAKAEFDPICVRKLHTMFTRMEALVKERAGFSVNLPRHPTAHAFTAEDSIRVDLPVQMLDLRREWVRFIFLRHLVYPIMALRLHTVTFNFCKSVARQLLDLRNEALTHRKDEGAILREFMQTIEEGIQCATKLGHVTYLAGMGSGSKSFPLAKTQARCIELSWQVVPGTVAKEVAEGAPGHTDFGKSSKDVHAEDHEAKVGEIDQQLGHDSEDASCDDASDDRVPREVTWSYEPSWKRWVSIQDKLPPSYSWPTMSKSTADDGLSGYWTISSATRFQLSSSETICLTMNDPDKPSEDDDDDDHWWIPGLPSGYDQEDVLRDDGYTAKYRHLELINSPRDGFPTERRTSKALKKKKKKKALARRNLDLDDDEAGLARGVTYSRSVCSPRRRPMDT
ncbi:hypothetical protein EJ02DRAFT_465780 [Clathrospora elynae]|uniref:Uncharacterized protein n=1 Tax=Clathrospora elynae TaxID=706981 RepID=A0A6A5SRQ3_9PLEO|nr:hypothetical protein EJ02DRAFT_465780 [Clathrospora elynae]